MVASVFLWLAFLICNVFGINGLVFADGVISESSITVTTSGGVSTAVKPSKNKPATVSSNYFFNVSTDNYTGYTLRIVSQDDTGRLNKTTPCESTDNSKCYISSITSPTATITANNTWGYKPSYFDSSVNTNFLPAPGTSGDIINVTNSANALGASDTYTIAVGVKVDYTLEPGDYTKTFTITAVGNPVAYDIEYVDNTSDETVSGLPSSHQTGSIENGVASVALIPYGENDDGSIVPTRDGFVFAGWCSVATTNFGTFCESGTYTYDAVHRNYGILDISEIANNNILKMYAVWTPNTYTISLSNTNATTTGSTSATATYYSSVLTPITNPLRTYNITGLAANGVNSDDAVVNFNDPNELCTSNSSCSYSFNFDGWYTATDNGTKVINNEGSLEANTYYTDEGGRWTSISEPTFYAQWSAGTPITLPTITKEGHTCGWATAGNTTELTYSSGQDDVTLTGNITLYGTCTADTYDITLDNNGASTTGSTNTTVTYGDTNLGEITLPTRVHNVSGFTLPAENNADGATVSDTSTLTSAYTFKGWYKESDATHKIASNATTPILEPSTAYTDSEHKWIDTSNAVTLYAGWDGQTITLPTITKEGHTCGWTESATDATAVTFSSGASIIPEKSYTLYGVCEMNKYSVVIKAAAGIRNVSLNGQVCTSVNGCTVSGLLYGRSYALTAQTST